MKKNTLTFLALSICVSFMVLPTKVWAECSCELMSSEAQETAADAIFTAKTLGPSEEANNGIWTTMALQTIQKETDSSKPLLSALMVGDERKIRLAQKISVCNFNFEEGKTYKVFAMLAKTQQGVDYLTTGQCAGTKEITEETQAEEKVKESAPEQPAQEQTENKGQ